MDDFLEKGILRNSKRFSAVFERIYDKVGRAGEGAVCVAFPCTACELGCYATAQ